VGAGVVLREIDLGGNAFPMRVSVRRDQIAGNITREDRNRIHADLDEIGAEHNVWPTTSHRARFFVGRLRMYSGNRSILTRVWVPSARSWPLLRPCIG